MAADITTHVKGSHLTLQHFKRSEHRSLRTTGAKSRRTRNHGGIQFFQHFAINTVSPLKCAGQQLRSVFLQEPQQAAHHHLTGILSGQWQHIASRNSGIQFRSAQNGVERLFEIIRLTFLNH